MLSFTTEEQILISFLKNKSTYHELVQNEMELLTQDFIAKMRKSIENYDRKCKPMIEDHTPVPIHVRKKINSLLIEAKGKSNSEKDPQGRIITATVFANEIKDTVWDLLKSYKKRDYYTTYNNNKPNISYYRGLDSDIDKANEVDNILRIYPEVLQYYPDGVFSCETIKSILFIPQIARLRAELLESSCDVGNVSDEEKRSGGLFHVDKNDRTSLHYLISCQNKFMTSQRKKEEENPDWRSIREDRCLTAVNDIREMNLIDIKDIEKRDIYSTKSDKMLRYLIHWNPYFLKWFDSYGCNALHHTCWDIRKIQTILELSLKYFPIKEGICFLFRLDDDGLTPFFELCDNFGKAETTKAIDNVLSSFPLKKQPYNALESILFAATNESVDVECINFILRRDPSVLKNLLQQ